MKKRFINRIIVLAVVFFVNMQQVFAEGCENCPGIADVPGDQDEEPVSIDNAILWLMIAALLLGTYYFLKSRKQVRA